MTDKITITVAELDRLTKWVNSLTKPPISIRLERGGNNGIVSAIVAYTDYGDGGEWKQITDYSEW